MKTEEDIRRHITKLEKDIEDLEQAKLEGAKHQNDEMEELVYLWGAAAVDKMIKHRRTGIEYLRWVLR